MSFSDTVNSYNIKLKFNKSPFSQSLPAPNTRLSDRPLQPKKSMDQTDGDSSEKINGIHDNMVKPSLLRIIQPDKELKDISNRHLLTSMILNHLSQYAFGIGNKYTSCPKFLSNIEEIIEKFDIEIRDHPTFTIKMQDARLHTNAILGKKKGVLKKRRIFIEPTEQEEINRGNDQRMFCDAIFLLMFAAIKHSDLVSSCYNKEQFLETYGYLFTSVSEDELQTMIVFRNLMKICMYLINANGNKGYLLDLITRLVEGHARKYITGSGATIETKRRVRVYENEGGVVVAIRPERRKIKEAKMLGSLISILPVDEPAPTSPAPSSFQVISPSILSTGAEREAAEGIASMRTTTIGSLSIDLRLEESQDSIVWKKAVKKFANDTPLNRNHSLI